MSQINDIALVAQVVVFKNTRAFDTLVKKYQSPIRRFFLHQTLGDTELSDDLAQETFIKAFAEGIRSTVQTQHSRIRFDDSRSSPATETYSASLPILPRLPSIHPQTISAPCFALPYAIYGTTPVRRSIQTSFFSHHIFLADRNARSAVRLPACTSYLFIINILFTFIITFATLAKIFSAYFLPIPHTVRPAARTR